MFIYGKNPVIDLFNKDSKRILEVYLDKNKYKEFYKKLVNTNIKIFSYEDFKLRDNNWKTSQKIIAKVKDIKYLTLDELIIKNKNNKKSILIVLDHIQDPHNFGAIIRSVAAFKGNGIIFTKDHSSPFNATVIKASSGNWANIDFCKINSLNSAIKVLKKNGFWIFSTDSHSKIEINKYKNFNKPMILIFGSEGTGIRKSIKEKSDFLFKIPIANDVESLNVSVAVAISLYVLK